MKKLFFFLASSLLLQKAFSQKETFDIATYTPPKNWKKEANTGVVNYTSVNTTTGRFCVITLYASKASSGDAQKDFNNEWKELVVMPYKAEANPEKQTQATSEGWKVVSAAAQAKLDGNDFYVLLSVISGFGKSISIRTSLNDASYTTQIDAFLGSVELDNTKKIPVTNNALHPVDNNSKELTSGGAGKFGLMMYKTPAGWSEQKFSDGVVFKPMDLPANEHLAMQIMQPLNFSGTLEQALSKSYDEAAIMYKSTKMYMAGEGNYQKTEVKRSFTGWEYIRGNGGVQVENGTPYKTELGLDLFVIKINNRFERIAVLKSRTNCNLSRYYSTDRITYSKAIDNFLFSLQFTDAIEAALKPGTTKGVGITGVWQGISLQTSATAGIRYNVFSPIFLSNGQAYFGTHFPAQGLDELNTRIPPEINRRDWGTYTFSNGRGILKMPYGDIPLRMEGNKLIITTNRTDHKFYQLPSVDGARFSGTYTLPEYNGKIHSITFTADGRFTDNGAVRILYHEYVDCINPAIKPGSGTYVVKDYSILFNYTDGRKIKLAFLGADYDIRNQSPATLRMSSNEDEMRRR